MLHSGRSIKIGPVLRRMNLSRLQAVAILALVAYAGALIARGYQVVDAGDVLRRTVDVIPGWRFALLGWVAPLEFCVAWFANIPFVICVFKLLRGNMPGHFLSVFTAGLAASALLPQLIFQPADGWHIGHVGGPAVWLWLVSIAVAVLGPRMVSRSGSTPS